MDENPIYQAAGAETVAVRALTPNRKSVVYLHSDGWKSKAPAPTLDVKINNLKLVWAYIKRIYKEVLWGLYGLKLQTSI